MKTFSPGKIFLNEQRGCSENAAMRIQSTFNFGGFHSAHKQPFGRLRVLNENVLAPGSSLTLTADKPGFLLILPVVGRIEYEAGYGSYKVEAGQVLLIGMEAGKKLDIRNPLEKDLVNFLEIRIAGEASGLHSSAVIDFDIDAGRNRLVDLQPHFAGRQFPFYAGICKLDGRQELEYQTREAGNELFTFVIQGAFEVQNRLLHQGDGLALWEPGKVEMEALSNDAIILVLDLLPPVAMCSFAG